MLRRLLLPVLLMVFLGLPALAATDPLLQASDAFDKACMKAATLEELFPLITADSVKMLKALPAEEQQQWIGLVQSLAALSVAQGPMKLTERQETGNKGRLVFKQEKKEKQSSGSSSMTVTKEIHLRKEGGVWKVDVTSWKF